MKHEYDVGESKYLWDFFVGLEGSIGCGLCREIVDHCMCGWDGRWMF